MYRVHRTLKNEGTLWTSTQLTQYSFLGPASSTLLEAVQGAVVGMESAKARDEPAEQ